MIVLGVDLSPTKYGACWSRVFQKDLLELESPIRIEYPSFSNGRDYSENERSFLIAESVLMLAVRTKANLVAIEDTRISYMVKGKDGKQIFKSQGYQDYFAKGVIHTVAFGLWRKNIELHFVSNPSMVSTCLGKGIRKVYRKEQVKEMGRQHIINTYGVSCPNDDYSDAAMLVEYTWKKWRW